MTWILGAIIYILVMKIIDLKSSLDETISAKRRIEDDYISNHIRKIRGKLKHGNRTN